MRISAFAVSAAALILAGCVEKTPMGETPTYHLTATVTSANTCSVSVLDSDYSSIGQIRGDVPKNFVGTVSDKNYHGFGCWVSTSGGDGDLIVLFSQNNLGKPLEAGTYPLVNEVYDNTPRGVAAVFFRPSKLGGDRLRTLDGAAGNVIVEPDGNGGVTIRVDAEVVRWGPVL